ncbi:outer membrane protein [Kordiimonas lacus]|uniref:Opacity protein n=1 Tax=Kordiimonas lacus TaxID=637679 RepID=A0A1G6VIG0_9PROT|nr:outer membrane beta-barrel protein [Kordiimonas lacus]SDD53324.1 Opacity protein [Kordiimonas lacus]
MKFSKTIMGVVTASTLLAAGASAADGERKFDGAYAGIEAGVDWTKLAGDVKRDRSLYYGGVIGFRRQMDNNMVYGLEGTFGDTGYNNNATGMKSEYEWSASLTLGQAFGSDGANLIYGKAGYVRTRFDPTSADGDAFNDNGWRFGGGYERALGESLSLRVGADYTTYGDDKNAWTTKAGLIARF